MRPSSQENEPSLYQQLGQDEFRVLHFLKKHESGTLEYTLTAHDIKRPPLYFGLSYCWGAPVFDAEITCNGHRVKVTTTLHEALVQLQQHGKPYDSLWIDQVCIRQDDIQEKQQQILMMGKIYSQADTTLIWLGPFGKRGSPDVVSHLECLDRARQAENDALEDGKFDPDSIWAQRYIDPEAVGLPPDCREDWEGLRDFFSRPWFRRIWVVQEVALANKDQLMLYGDKLIPFGSLSRGVNWFYKHTIRMTRYFGVEATELLHKMHYLFFDITASVGPVRNSSGALAPWDLESLLILIYGFQATNGCDVIYGIFGLTDLLDGPDQIPSFMLPFYRSGPDELYRSTVLHCIEKSGRLLAIRRVGLLDRQSQTSTGSCALTSPSWTPIFNTIERTPTWFNFAWSRELNKDGLQIIRMALEYHASAWMPPQVREHADPRTLSLKGLQVDRVKQVWPPFPRAQWEDPSNTLRADLWDAAAESSGIEKGASDEELFRFFVRFLLAMAPIENINNYDRLHVPSFKTLFYYKAILDNSFKRRLPPSEPPRIWALDDLPPEEISEAMATELPPVHNMYSYSLFVTEGGHLGHGPYTTQSGDYICVLFGGHNPVVLEKCGEGFHILGEAFIREFASGEAIDTWKKGELEETWVDIH